MKKTKENKEKVIQIAVSLGMAPASPDGYHSNNQLLALTNKVNMLEKGKIEKTETYSIQVECKNCDSGCSYEKWIDIPMPLTYDIVANEFRCFNCSIVKCL